jgi:hypothetical protein
MVKVGIKNKGIIYLSRWSRMGWQDGVGAGARERGGARAQGEIVRRTPS